MDSESLYPDYISHGFHFVPAWLRTGNPHPDAPAWPPTGSTKASFDYLALQLQRAQASGQARGIRMITLAAPGHEMIATDGIHLIYDPLYFGPRSALHLNDILYSTAHELTHSDCFDGYVNQRLEEHRRFFTYSSTYQQFMEADPVRFVAAVKESFGDLKTFLSIHERAYQALARPYETFLNHYEGKSDLELLKLMYGEEEFSNRLSQLIKPDYVPNDIMQVFTSVRIYAMGALGVDNNPMERHFADMHAQDAEFAAVLKSRYQALPTAPITPEEQTILEALKSQFAKSQGFYDRLRTFADTLSRACEYRADDGALWYAGDKPDGYAVCFKKHADCFDKTMLVTDTTHPPVDDRIMRSEMMCRHIRAQQKMTGGFDLMKAGLAVAEEMLEKQSAANKPRHRE